MISYEKSYNIKDQNKRVVVKLNSWVGAVAEIIVNDNQAGLIAWPPYELDITNNIKGGKNKISVNIYGTLKNLLGPHHIGAIRGTAWPASALTMLMQTAAAPSERPSQPKLPDQDRISGPYPGQLR